MTLSELVRRANLSLEEASAQAAELEAEGRLIALGASPPGPTTLLYSSQSWASLQNNVQRTLSGYHQQHPLRRGMPREELRNRLGLPADAFLAAVERLAAEGALVQDGQSVNPPGPQTDA